MKKVSSEIDIAASPELVWAILTNLEDYPRWNPFIPSIEGDLSPGASIRVVIQPPGAKGMTFRPRLLAVVPGRELRWLGKLLVPGIFDGEHHFWIEPAGYGAVTFHQEETFRGLLVPFTGSVLERTAQGFEAMNRALKSEAEG